jgi:spoIIIJ-associated protein
VPAKKFSVETTGPRITAFLEALIRNAGFELMFEVTDGGQVDPDFENPDIVVRFRGRDTSLLLANKAEILLAMEHLTMEMLPTITARCALKNCV